ncbi:MAG TPA: GAF domain-containing protein [Desulfuromonadales bacterium]|nr:GAF domain-containing protein [Desulfuromonadales bacterium]
MHNSLKFKIVGLVAVIVIAVISAASWQHYLEQKKIIEHVTEKSSLVLIDSIVSNIQSAMKAGHTTAVNDILGKVKAQDHINELRIINENGKILHSADKKDIGKMLSDEEQAKIRNNPQDHFYFSNSKNEFDSYTRIANTPDCHGCHDAKKPFIAIIETEISLNDLTHYIDLEKKNAIYSSLAMIILIVGALFLFLMVFVDRPLKHLITSMQQIEKGNFDISTNITSSNEMSLLSHNFNMMVSKLKELMESTVISERELARAEEKLAHHHETHLMNLKLEEQLKEIENLNVSLEERIEEVEQASYTIADLAAELEQKNANLEHAIERLSTIYKIGLAINSTIDIDRLFNLIVRSTTSTLHAHIGYIILYDKEQQELNVTNLIGSGKLLAPKKTLPMKSTSVSSWVINNREPLLIADIDQAPQFDRFSELGYERKSLICSPLIVKDEIIGTISVVNKVDNTQFNSDELDMLTTIAAQAAIAIKNATLYEEQQQTYLNTIQALVSAIEASDSYTRGHSERVTRYSVEIGRRLDLPAERMQILERAAVLHDIGKIGIDLSLLHKEGKLSARDIHDLQQHPLIGMKILEPIGFLQDVRTCIGQHHERFDGMGYPSRIKHTDQLLESRILSVVDAFDAMTSDRPYRKALSLDVAMAELAENSGTQFDPAIVDVFVSILEEGTFFQARMRDVTHPHHSAISA